MISNNDCTNKGNGINNKDMSFTGYKKAIQFTASPKVLFTSNASRQTEEHIEIDTELCQLSSWKLWQILKLSQVKGCELEQVFLQEVQAELIIRDDFDNGEAWNDPH